MALVDERVAHPNAGVLLSYQQELLEATASEKVLVVEKSRRIGATWAVAADAVLRAGAGRSARGSDVFYIGFNLEMAREFIDACGDWARAFSLVAESVQEVLFEDGDAERGIKAFRIEFASGFQILALCARPRSLRGRQGFVIIDEAAFHDELEELLKAAFALLMWGGRVLIISTHDGADNPFAQLVDDCRAGRRPYRVLRTTFNDALKAGLYRRICETEGKAWSFEGELEWEQEIRAIYGDGAEEELDCIPRRSGGKYLARTLLEARATGGPVLRWACDDAFVDLSDDARTAAAREFFTNEVLPVLRAADAGGRSYLGEDFGRSGDLTVLWPLVVGQDLRRRTPCVVELRNVPFRQQEQIVFWLIDALGRFSGGAFDASGNGQYLAEFARQRYGAHAIAEVKLSEQWYREHMPPLKAALEDDSFELPPDSEIIDDFRSLEVVRGVARVPDTRTSGATGKRHGDGAIAGALALFASRTLDAGPLVVSGAGNAVSQGGFAGHLGAGTFRSQLAGWNQRS